MCMQVAHAPGLALTETLLQGPLGKGWASRVFFSDDGSTAVEVALKMAFRKYLVDHGLTEAVAGDKPVSLEVSRPLGCHFKLGAAKHIGVVKG